jgi:hypothetical protein
VTVHILVEVVPVGPRKARLADQAFAIILSSAWEGDLPPDPDQLDATLLPWRWEEPAPPRRFVWPASRPLGGYRVQAGTHDRAAPIVDPTPRTPLLHDPSVLDPRAWIRARVAEQYVVGRAPPETSDPKLRKETLYSQLGTLATNWGAVPEHLRLVRYFNFPAQADDAVGSQLLAFPALRFCDESGSEGAVLELFPEADQPESAIYHYKQAPDGDLVAVLEIRRVEVSRDEATGLLRYDGEPLLAPDRKGLNFASYWFFAEPEPVPPPSTDVSKNGMGADVEPGHASNKAVPHPLVLNLLAPEQTGELPVDPWHKVAGVGFLLRRAGATSWSCLNGAWLEDRALSGSGRVLATPMVAPLPLLLRGKDPANGSSDVQYVRDSKVSYDQLPLFARPSTLAGESFSDPNNTQDFEQNLTLRDPTYALTQVRAGDGDDRLLLERLIYGESYEAAVFLTDIAGGLPEQLGVPRPWTLAEGAFTPEAAYVTGRIAYLRRVGIGHAEIAAGRLSQDSDANADIARWPTVPTGVVPLAQAILAEPSSADGAPRDHGAKAPIVLRDDGTLADGRTFSFWVRPPAVSREVAERWARTQAELRATLANAFAQGGVPSLDDPATDGCVLELHQWDLALGKWVLVDTKAYTFAPVSGRSDFSEFKVSVKSSAALTEAGVDVRVPGPASTLFQVSVYVAVRSDAVERFEVYGTGDDKQPYLELWHETKAGKLVLAPERFVIEVASRELPNAHELASAFRLDRDERRVVLALDPALVADANRRPRLLAIERVEVGRLEWVYAGEPRPWPSDVAAGWPSGTNPSEWERDALATLDERDVVQVPAQQVAHREIAAGRRSPVAFDDYSSDPRSRYLKYRLRGFSRYSGFYGGAPIETAPSPAEGPHQQGWCRTYLRYGGSRPSKPLIRALLPLTDAPLVNAQDPAAPLLVVIEEPPFTEGIAEELDCRVGGGRFPEAGRDPIVWAQSQPWQVPPDAEGIALRIEGPYGHTRDTGASRPFYTLGSYLVYAPENARGWDLAKVAFRRTQRSPWESSAPPEHASEWTEPTWIQFLPPRTFGGSLTAALSVDGKQVEVRLDRGQDLPGTPSAPASQFRYLLLVTHQIKDYRGRNREAFLALEVADFSSDPRLASERIVKFKINLDEPVGNREVKVRLCEVQLATDAELSGDPALGLIKLPDSGGPLLEAEYRLTRISAALPAT